MSVIPSEYAACPFPSNSSILLSKLAQAQDWWSYRQLRALQTNRTEGQFGHRPIYRPIISLSFTSPSPSQISSEHYFEWREVDSPLPIVAIHVIIHPSFAFAEPLFNIAGTHLKNFPIIHILWSDCPRHLNHISHNYIHNVLGDRYPDQNLDLFALKFDYFITSYYKAVTPYSLRQDLYPLSPTPPLSIYNPRHSSSEDQ